MNHTKIKVYKRVPKEVSKKYDRAEDFINSRIEEICSQEKFSAELVIYFLCFLFRFLTVK